MDFFPVVSLSSTELEPEGRSGSSFRWFSYACVVSGGYKSNMLLAVSRDGFHNLPS